MKTEIETKQRVESLEAMEEKLYQLGADFVAEYNQKDSYFDDPSGGLMHSDKCLRLRRELVGRYSKSFLTYKGPRQKSKFKQRDEMDVEISEPDAIEKLLVLLGYNKALVFEKKRRVYRLGGCDVALDDLALLGCFVEIEGPDDDAISKVQAKLGMADIPNIKESYASMMADKLRGSKGSNKA
jgi:adenylate cyclase class 2